jgi:radical SAM superfamily enzyme YgiQ (UPF0313 family)
MPRAALINGPTNDGGLFTREGRCTQAASIWAVQWPPVTLAYLAAMARAAGWKAALFDAPALAWSADSLLAHLHTFQPELCVLTVSTPTAATDLQTAAAIKAALPETKLALCGVHATVLDEEILAAHPAVDFVLRREPEQTFGELCRALDESGGVGAIAGLTWREGDTPRRNPDRAWLADLDALPFPAWDAGPLWPYRLPFRRDRFLCLTPLRGCPHHCSFCTAGAYYGHGLRRRSPESLVEEIAHDRVRYGVRDFFMWAETFTIDREFVLALCEQIARRAPGIRWTCNSRVDTVDAEMLAAMRAAGCWMVSFGIESTDAGVLEEAGKKMDPAATTRALAEARRAGLLTLGHFVLGLPRDSPRTLAATARDAATMDLDFAQFYTAAPFVGSPLYERLGAEGALKTDFEAMRQDRASFAPGGLTTAEVDRARRRATWRFLLRPTRLARTLRFAGFGLARQAGRLAWRALRSKFV